MLLTDKIFNTSCLPVGLCHITSCCTLACLQVMSALSEILADSRRGHQQQEQQQDVLWAVLHLAAGRQLKAAAALAASVGDVRLATLLASVNTAAHGRHAQLLLQQVSVSILGWGRECMNGCVI
jgi:hypothetical protein